MKRVDNFFLPLCLPSPENGIHFSEHCVVFDALRPPRVLPRMFFFLFFFVVSGIQAAALPTCRSESPHNPSKDLTWFQSKAISGTIGTCRPVLPRPSPSSPSVSVPLTQLYSSSSLQLLSCWTGLKHWTAAGGPPDVGCEPKTYNTVNPCARTVFVMLFVEVFCT